MGNKKFVLVIDGGGSWGVLPAKFCEKLENSLGGEDFRLKDKIDLFVGTSTGALICSALNIGEGGETLGLKAQKVYEKYQTLISTAFTDNPNFDPLETIVKDIFQVYLDPQFTREGINQALQDVFPNTNFGRYNLSRTLEGWHKPLAIVSYQLNAENALKVFKSWRDEDQDTKIIDALIASSSVPSVHPPHKINNRFYADGGLLAEEPILIAVQCVYEILDSELEGADILRTPGGVALGRRKIFEEGDEIHFISLSTGSEDINFDFNDFDQAGQIYWAKRIAKVFLRGQHSINKMFCDVLENIVDKRKLSLKFHRFDYNIQKHLNEFYDNENDRIKKGTEKHWDDLLDVAAQTWFEKLDTDEELTRKFNNLVDLMRS